MFATEYQRMSPCLAEALGVVRMYLPRLAGRGSPCPVGGCNGTLGAAAVTWFPSG